MNGFSSTSLRLALSILLIISIQPWCVEASNCNGTSVGFTPLNDLGQGTYNGRQGGLYPNGVNTRPVAHEAAGVLQARSIRPLDTNGQPSATGKIVLLSIGMSNTTQEFSVFKPLADADLSRNPSLVIVDGAQGGMSAEKITDPNSSTGMQFWNTVNQRLINAGVSPAQVQIAWVKQANATPSGAFPTDVTRLQADLTTIAQLLKDRFPNIRLAYYSSRIYAGYADTALNPEPYAYQAGFAVKWMIEQQINGAPELNYDPAHGTVRAPWLSWGPYLWADGLIPRSDGLTYACSDFQSDGTHPAPNGAREKVAQMLLNFFKTDSIARLWFRRQSNPIADFDGDGKTDLSVFRPTAASWFILNSSNNSLRAEAFGLAGDRIIPADYDGDGKADIAVWRPSSGSWYRIDSLTSTFRISVFGQNGDTPTPGDFDGDGKSDICVYRPSVGTFYLLYSSDGSFRFQQWGQTGDLPVVGDYDGDGRADFNVYRNAIGTFYYLRSSDGGVRATQWGASGDRPIAGDYDADGKTDIGVFRPSTGAWYAINSSDGGVTGVAWGTTGDVPVAADYDGDGKMDVAVFRPSNSIFYILQSTNSSLSAALFGTNGDLPVPSAFVP